ncbi:short-chain dehydrogenase TIC 32 B, chloroplastic-like isoform X2 [Oryza brachyantha]|uniref:short-chain dehydrogenase TIC 32 B, chloroplastic-like isoform X2 n=1 Tax=Oryza brachyantha TaxID=4533 RepID=UPI001ADA7FF5|nr:short-chain dehydrogenase TIC 32 B, chloroplastic-like isoform X2 [Oryza brachyantha]
MLTSLRYLTGTAGPSGFGSRATAEDATAACADLRHITAIITGATSGIGAETARVLAKRGARLVLPARRLKAAEEARARLLAECPAAGDVVVLPLDLSSLASVRRFAARFLALGLPLNLLINNAGKFADRFALSDDGVEMTFATNYLGHFLLTKLLLEKMAETARATGVEGRVVNVSSTIHSWFAGGDAAGYIDGVARKKIPYDPTRAYALSKLANVLHTRALADRLKEMKANVTANCVHPGIVRTRLIRERDGLVTNTVFFLASKLLKTIPQAAATTCYVAVHPAVAGVSGKYFADCNEASPSRLGSSGEEAAKLWRFSEEIAAEEKEESVHVGSFRLQVQSSNADRGLAFA